MYYYINTDILIFQCIYIDLIRLSQSYTGDAHNYLIAKLHCNNIFVSNEVYIDLYVTSC